MSGKMRPRSGSMDSLGCLTDASQHPAFSASFAQLNMLKKKKVYNGHGSSCHSIDIFPVQFGGKMETYQPVFNWAKSYRIASSQNFPYRCDLGIGTQIVQEAKSPSL